MSAQNGGLAQLARASGSYPAGRWFKSDIRYHFGSLVKRLRHRPFTAVTGVRFSYESPKRQRTPETVSSVFLMSRRYTNSIAHTLLALSFTNFAFVLSFPLIPTPSAMEFAYHQRWYLASCGEESHPRTERHDYRKHLPA